MIYWKNRYLKNRKKKEAAKSKIDIENRDICITTEFWVSFNILCGWLVCSTQSCIEILIVLLTCLIIFLLIKILEISLKWIREVLILRIYGNNNLTESNNSFLDMKFARNKIKSFMFSSIWITIFLLYILIRIWSQLSKPPSD